LERGVRGARQIHFLIPYMVGEKLFPFGKEFPKKSGEARLILSLTCHSGHMEKPKLPWFRVALLLVELLLLVAAVAFPLVIGDAAVTNFLRVLEILARMG
jgi:hypothetical protein